MTSWPKIPQGDLIAIADALIEFIGGIECTVYLILLRPLNSNKAVIAPSLITINNSENLLGWRNTFSQIPFEAKQRIKALVCDGRAAFMPISKENGWALQRCHFHLLARIAHNRSITQFTRTNAQGKYIQNLARIIINSKNENNVNQALEELKNITKNITSRSFKTVLSGLIRNYLDYRTYLRHPEFNLPTTSNSAEHLVGIIRDLQYRARGFNSIKSLTLWIEVLLKFTKTVTCNGKISIPN